MRARVLRAVLALLAVATMVVALASSAFAQDPTPVPSATATATQTEPTPIPVPTPTATPTPTVTPTPTPDPEEEKKAKLRERLVVKRVYRDYRRDGRIDNCEHTRKALKRTLESISDDFDADFPDFREAVKAAIKDWDKDRCAAEAAATPTPTATPAPTSTPAPTAVPTTPPSSSGTLPDLNNDDDNDNGGQGGAVPPSDTPTPPSEGDVVPVQPTATPTPTPTPAATPPAEAQLVVTRPSAQDANLLVPALLLAVALLGLAGAGAAAIYARRTGRLGGWGHAWREASYRATGAWGDFSDWLRLGR